MINLGERLDETIRQVNYNMPLEALGPNPAMFFSGFGNALKSGQSFTTGLFAAKTTLTSAPARVFEKTHGLSGNASTRTVQGLMDDMRVNGWQGKPIDVFEHNGSKYILDGHHRVEAAGRVGIEVPFNSVPESSLGKYFYKTADAVIRASTEAGPIKLRVR